MRYIKSSRSISNFSSNIFSEIRYTLYTSDADLDVPYFEGFLTKRNKLLRIGDYFYIIYGISTVDNGMTHARLRVDPMYESVLTSQQSGVIYISPDFEIDFYDVDRIKDHRDARYQQFDVNTFKDLAEFYYLNDDPLGYNDVGFALLGQFIRRYGKLDEFDIEDHGIDMRGRYLQGYYDSENIASLISMYNMVLEDKGHDPKLGAIYQGDIFGRDISVHVYPEDNDGTIYVYYELR